MRLSLRQRIRQVSLVVGMGLLVSWVYAASVRVIEYQYDEAGNLTGISSMVATNPPSVSGLAPGAINVGMTIVFLATGSELLEADVTTSHPGLIVSGVSSTLDEVRFSLTAENDATPGAAVLTYTTPLGSDTAAVTVEDRRPRIATDPSPVVLPPDSISRAVRVLFDTAQVIDETYDLSISEASIASVSPAEITVPAGSTTATVEIAGIAVGSTTLTLAPRVLPFPSSVPVFVADGFTGDGNDQARAVGVIVGNDDPTSSSIKNVFVPRVGVVVGSEDQLTPVVDDPRSSPVGVIVTPVAPIGASPVGVLVGQETPIVGSLSGALVGPVLLGVEPRAVSPGTSLDLNITGVNLDDVVSVSVDPPGDVTVGAFSISADGKTVTVLIDVDAAAPAGPVLVFVGTSTGGVEALNTPTLEISIE